jgi:hypothetical protein
MKKLSIESVVMTLIFIGLIALFPSIIFIKDAKRFRLVDEERVYSASALTRHQYITFYPEIDRLIFDDFHFQIAFEISSAPHEIMKMARGERSAMLESRSHNSPHLSGYAGRQEIREYPEIGLVFLFDNKTLIGRWKTEDTPKIIRKIISARKE